MRWSKIKNIILILLAMVNVCLLFIVGSRFWQTEHTDRELREQMRVILRQNGVEFLPEEVPGEMPVTALQLTLTPFGETQAAQLVGTGEVFFSSEGALMYHGELGSAVCFPEGRVNIQFFPDAFPLKDASLAETGHILLSKLNLDLRETRSEEQDSVTFTQFISGVPVPEATLTLTSQNGALDRLSGRVLMGSETVIEGEYLSASTALTRFIGDLQKQTYVCSQITGIYPGYAVSGTGPVTLTPIWCLETDAAWQCVVDGLTGVVTVKEPTAATT